MKSTVVLLRVMVEDARDVLTVDVECHASLPALNDDERRQWDVDMRELRRMIVTSFRRTTGLKSGLAEGRNPL